MVVKGVRVGARLAEEEEDMVTALKSEDGVAEDKSGSAGIDFGSGASGDEVVISATARGEAQGNGCGQARASNYGGGGQGKKGGRRLQRCRVAPSKV